MLQLDEVFHRARAPGIKGFSNVPSSFMFPADYQVDFDKHFATVEELTYEEQKVCDTYGIVSQRADGCMGRT